MARLKKSPRQEQISDSLRARAVTITPIHRESIVTPNHISIVPKAPGTMADDRTAISTITGDHNIPKRSKRANDDSGWMTKWFTEPGSDVGACCMGFWVPCALYGKVDWRLRQVAMGEDALDESWRCKYGCNYPCVVYWVVELLTPRCLLPGNPRPYPQRIVHILDDQFLNSLEIMKIIRADELDVLGIFVALQRSQIRGTYGIDGSVGVDFARGLFCTVCTLVHNDREVRAREGQESLRNNKKYNESGESSVVTTQPSLRPEMRSIWSKRPKQPQPTSDRPIEMTQPSVLNETDDVTDPASHKGGYEKTRAWPPRKKSQEQRNEAQTVESGQEYHPQSGNSQIRAKVGAETTTMANAEQMQNQPKQNHNKLKVKTEVKSKPDMKSERSDRQQKLQDLKIMPTVIVTKPQDSQPARGGSSVLGQRTEQSGISIVQGKEPLSKEHDLMECPTLRTIEEVNSRTGQENHSLMDCITTEDVQKRQLDLHDLTNCNAIIESSTVVQQHSLADCDNSAVSDNQELTYVHDFTDCPVDKAVLDYYEKQEKSIQSHNLADCAKGSSAGKVRLESGVPQQELTDSARRSVDSPNRVVRGNSHTLGDCSGRSSENNLPSNNAYLEHSLADCLSDCSQSSTVRSEKQHRSLSGIVDSASKHKTHKGIQHRLSSCPTPIAMSANRNSDDGQAMQTPNNLSTNVDQRRTDARSGSGTNGSHVNVGEGRIQNRQRRRNKGKGKANENATKTGGGESSRPTELSVQ